MDLKQAQVLAVKAGPSTFAYENGKVNLRLLAEPVYPLQVPRSG